MSHPAITGRGVHNRRSFLVASAAGFAGYSFAGSGSGLAAPSESVGPGKAKSTILFFLCGGASHVDTWDMKPDAPKEYRGPFNPIETSAPGVQLCEHLPLLAQQAHHLALVNSVAGTVNTNDHHAGYYHNLTGHVPDTTFRTKGNNRTPYPDDWPYMGTVVASKRPDHEFLPNAISLPHMPSRKPYTRPGQFAARLGVEHDPLYLDGDRKNPLKFQAPSLVLEGGRNTGEVNRAAKPVTHTRQCSPRFRPIRRDANPAAPAGPSHETSARFANDGSV